MYLIRSKEEALLALTKSSLIYEPTLVRRWEDTVLGVTVKRTAAAPDLLDRKA